MESSQTQIFEIENKLPQIQPETSNFGVVLWIILGVIFVSMLVVMVLNILNNRRIRKSKRRTMRPQLIIKNKISNRD